ncbi:biotin/lipoyl-binding protein [Kitasatospora kifunensis]|uniref:Multidrug efflux pump subunit AcrA (Membrane-fusion protein) n=1 Tax=Kitasatospora kifunensis TaxID=58351 RepID=A0A7W7R2T1_KITKI|nr:biotin/lipoyl-binding protein [Kitasatospora kifunensis]MBB4924378.1 multidrug efflux pump subunit AcrA (membrane-fusion protein) [Kitasatospora kifunensis]
MKVLPRRRGAVLVNSVLGVALLAGGALAYTTVNSTSSAAAGKPLARTATVSKGTVLATVSGSGTLSSPTDAGENFVTGGKLTAVKVSVGDTVTQGEVLATVDTTAAQQALDAANGALTEAQAGLASAQANLTKAQAGTTTTTTVPVGSTGAVQASWVQSSPSPSASDSPTASPSPIASASSPATHGSGSRSGGGSTPVTAAPVSSTDSSSGGSSGTSGNSNSGSTGSNTGNSSNSNSGGSSDNSGSGGNARSDVPAPQTTTITTTKVDPAAVAQAQQQVTQAQQQVATAQTGVTNAQTALAGTTLTASVGGTVASISNKVGDTVAGTGSSTDSSGGAGGSSAGSSSSKTTSASTSSTPSGFIVITNPTGMQVTADFSELDSLKLKKGEAATVTLNAQSSTTLSASVLSVSSLPVSSGSSSAGAAGSAVQYGAVLQINGDTSALRTGLSATISVVTGEADNALSVPATALSGTGTSRTATLVKPDGTTSRVDVTVGVVGDTTVQVVSGLNQGDKVQLASATSGGSNGFPSGAFPGGFGGGAGGGGGRGGAGGAGGGAGGGGGRGGN